MSALYTPQEGSTAWKVIEFLTSNPDEALSAEDVSAKFDVPKRTVHTHLSRAITDKVLKRTEDLKSGELAYALDQGHPTIQARPGTHPTLGARRVAPTGGLNEPAAKVSRKRLAFIDVAEIAVTGDVPLPGPAKNSSAPKTDWPGLLGRLTQKGDSFAVPRELRYAIAKQVSAYKKAHAASGWDYTMRGMPDGTVRVWRTA